MTTLKTKMAYTEAKEIADRVVYELAPVCERIEIAGSVRRMKTEVGDLEIVAIPKTEPYYDLFHVEVARVSLLDQRACNLYKLLKGGLWYKQFDVGPIMLDLFITTPEKWGVIFTIRTGSAEFSHRLVMSKSAGGLCPGDTQFRDGRIWKQGVMLSTPEEADVFKALHLDWIDPEKRI